MNTTGRGGNRKHPAGCNCGKCPKIGRKKKEPLSKVRKDVAFDVFDEFNKGKTALNPTGRTEKQRWVELADSKNEDIAFRALSKLKDCVDGKPAEKVEEKVIFDPNQPLRVIIEHIGGPEIPAAT